jgi:hypothetical protein
MAVMGHRHWFVGETPVQSARAKLMLQVGKSAPNPNLTKLMLQVGKSAPNPTPYAPNPKP